MHLCTTHVHLISTFHTLDCRFRRNHIILHRSKLNILQCISFGIPKMVFNLFYQVINLYVERLHFVVRSSHLVPKIPLICRCIRSNFRKVPFTFLHCSGGCAPRKIKHPSVNRTAIPYMQFIKLALTAHR